MNSLLVFFGTGYKNIVFHTETITVQEAIRRAEAQGLQISIANEKNRCYKYNPPAMHSADRITCNPDDELADRWDLYIEFQSN